MIPKTPLAQAPDIGHRPKRRWWIYLAIGAGLLSLCAVATVVGIVVYWRSLVRDYTASQPQPLPAVQASDADFAALQARWMAFQESVVKGRTASPFEATAADLNLLIAQNANLKDHLRVTITNNQILGQFAFPLTQTGKPELAGRYLNGQARLQLEFQDGWLTVSVADLKANGKPIPGWILKKVRQQNLLKDLDRNPKAGELLRQLEAIQVEDDRIVVRPSA